MPCADQPAMPLAGDLVEDHAGDRDARVVMHAAERDRGRRLRLAGDVDHQHDRPAEQRREIGARAGVSVRARHAVEQPHRAFDDDEVGAVGRLARDLAQQRVGHGEGVEIGAGRAGRGGMEGRDRYSPGPHFSPRTVSPRRASARSRPSVIVVLPAPERGAAMIRPARGHGRASAAADARRACAMQAAMSENPARPGPRCDAAGRRAPAPPPRPRRR